MSIKKLERKASKIKIWVRWGKNSNKKNDFVKEEDFNSDDEELAKTPDTKNESMSVRSSFSSNIGQYSGIPPSLLQPSGEPVPGKQFQVHRLKDEPSQEKLVELIDRNDDDFDYNHSSSSEETEEEQEIEQHKTISTEESIEQDDDAEFDFNPEDTYAYSKKNGSSEPSIDIKIVASNKPDSDDSDNSEETIEVNTSLSTSLLRVRSNGPSKMPTFDRNSHNTIASVYATPPNGSCRHDTNSILEDKHSDVFFSSSSSEKVVDSSLRRKVDGLSRFVFAMVDHEKNLLQLSALKIQSTFRGYIIRKKYQLHLSIIKYNTTLYPPNIDNLLSYGMKTPHFKICKSKEKRDILLIQHIIRGFLMRRRYILVLHYHKSARKIQAFWRGHAARYKPPPNCPPLGGVIRSLATHRLAVQKLAVQISDMSSKMQTLSKCIELLAQDPSSLLKPNTNHIASRSISNTSYQEPIPRSTNNSSSKNHKKNSAKAKSGSSNRNDQYLSSLNISFQDPLPGNLLPSGRSSMLPNAISIKTSVSNDDHSFYDFVEPESQLDYERLTQQVESLQAKFHDLVTT